MHIGWVQSKYEYSGVKRKFSFIMLGFELTLSTLMSELTCLMLR